MTIEQTIGRLSVMASRVEPVDSLDDFQTPPFATRALLTHVIYDEPLHMLSAWEPACGRGHMLKPLAERFERVRGTDVNDYGHGYEVCDFLKPVDKDADWIITNPPFRLAEEFALHALRIAHRGVALLVRSTFTESVGRHANLFGPFPPWAVAQFCERIPMVKGRYDPKASTATGYAWIIWRKHNREPTRFIWIPPCRKALERPDDHILKGAKNV